WLEVGPGGGVLLTSLLSLGLPPSSMTACEPSPQLCSLISSRHPLVDVRPGYVEDTLDPSAPEKYDVVTMLEVVEHVEPGGRRGMMERLKGAMKPGGWLFLSTI
ncbi:hypothetical protein TrRE_jg892, partial [Triparma retinervis]